MTQDTDQSKRPVARRIVQIASIGALLALAGTQGCSRSDEAEVAVKQAGRSFNSIAAGDPTAFEEFSEKTYRQAEALVAPHAGSDTGYEEAAAVSVALAKNGLASLASQNASSFETQALHKARIIRGMINEQLTMSAIAIAAGQFDASQELADIERIITLRQEDIKVYQAQREEIDAKIASIDALIVDLRAKSQVERNESGALELEMPRVSATQAAQIVQRVREHTLRADQFELEAIRNDGIVGQLRPGAREISLNVDKATSQIALLQDARKELKAREASSKEDATQARNAAAQATKRIQDAVADYDEFRKDEVDAANEAAISMARAAISALRDADGPIKQIASLTKSSIEQTLAECHARQAAGFAEAAILYNALIEAKIDGQWSNLAQEALESQAESKAAANEAYQSAATSLRRAGIRGDEAEKIEATAIRLDKLGGVVPEPEIIDEPMDEYDDDSGEMIDEEYDPSTEEESEIDEEG